MTDQHSIARQIVLAPRSAGPDQATHVTGAAEWGGCWGSGQPSLCASKPSSEVAASPDCSTLWEPHLSGSLGVWMLRWLVHGQLQHTATLYYVQKSMQTKPFAFTAQNAKLVP